MKKLIFGLFILFVFGSSSWAMAPRTPAEELQVKQSISQWYQQVGLSGVISEQVFETAIRGYFHYSDKGNIPVKNYMGIVDYSKPALEERFFIFQFGPGARMLRREHVAHGSGKLPDDPLSSGMFSNEDGTHKSSRGFSKTLPSTYTGKFGYSLRLEGLEQQINNRMRPRAIVMHPAHYVGPGQQGQSWGCLSLALDKSKPVIDLMKGVVLIYGSDGNNHNDSYTFMGGTGNISAQDVSGVSSASVDAGDAVDPEVSTFESIEAFQGAAPPTGELTPGGADYGALGTPGGIPSLDAMSAFNPDEDEDENNTFSGDMTNPGTNVSGAALVGTASLVECQNRSSAPWGTVIAEARKGQAGNPSKFFDGTWKQMNDRARNMDQTVEAVRKNMAIDLDTVNKGCVALAFSMVNSYTEKENPNEPETYTTADGAVSCKYEGIEGQQYAACLKYGDVHDGALIKEQVNLTDEDQDYKGESATRLAAVQNSTDIQAAASAAQVASTNSAASIALSRSNFQTGKFEALSTAFAAMPTRNSILNGCRRNMVGKHVRRDKLKAYVDHLLIKDKTLPAPIDHCYAVAKTMKTNLIQNTSARKQVIQVMEKVGLKIHSLNAKERALLNQGSLASKARIGKGSSSGFNVVAPAIGNFKDNNNTFGFSGKVDFNKDACKNGSCKYKGGSGARIGTSAGSGRTRNRNTGTQYAAFKVPTGHLRGSGSGASKKVLTFDVSKKKRGVYNDSFYNNVNMALAGKIDPNRLSKAQKKEYLALLDYQKYRQSAKTRAGNLKSKSQKDGVKGKGREIWFDTKMDLFKIISNRYKAVFNKP